MTNIIGFVLLICTPNGGCDNVMLYDTLEQCRTAARVVVEEMAIDVDTACVPTFGYSTDNGKED